MKRVHDEDPILQSNVDRAGSGRGRHVELDGFLGGMDHWGGNVDHSA